ncbi:uncharacterized protein LOC131684226 [Topomyia yanbarensis]|uniref:uncharacterized protein LOC131684226 n=1 Tax=Topomyia yanbarensis TaxID=2498891 RepID=UPI00273AE044|nr:uncharacterized protein LOC131684226 [Topomyia yanbarensis]
MDINVNEFMRKSTKAYNFQYLDINHLDRIIRNVQKNSDVQIELPVAREIPAESKQGNVRMLSDNEIDEILRTAEMDLQEEPVPDEESVRMEEPISFVIDENRPTEAEDDEFSDEASTICSSSASSVFCSPSKDTFQATSDELTADIEDNLIGDEDYDFNDSVMISKNPPVVASRSMENCFEFLDSESIVEELEENNENDGDSEGSINVAPVIRVRSPVRPASAIIKTYEVEDTDPVTSIQPILDFAAIERSNKSSHGSKQEPIPKIPSNSLIRQASRKSLVEEFDTFVKITELQKKACLLIDDIRHCLGKEVEEPEDEYEERKREKRTTEFFIRFQRNYLYQINRLEEDVYIMAKNSFEFAQKVYQLYKLICQGLKFYLKNMKYFVINVSPDKLWTLVKQIISSTKVCMQKGIFDEDDLIVEEINEKCQLLKYSLKEEASRKKRKDYSRKRSKVSSHPSASPMLTTKLSMYGVTTSVQKRSVPTHKSISSVTKKSSSSKPHHAKQPPKDTTKKPQCGKIIAVPVTKSSSSSLGQSKSRTRVRSARTPAGTIDDVVTQVQHQSDPLANSRLLKEVSSALTKMSTSRDAAISPEVNQQLRQLIMDTIQNITQQQLKQLIPSLEVSLISFIIRCFSCRLFI